MKEFEIKQLIKEHEKRYHRVSSCATIIQAIIFVPVIVLLIILVTFYQRELGWFM